jgi:hypothetical protein
MTLSWARKYTSWRFNRGRRNRHPKDIDSLFNPATARYEAASDGPLKVKALPAERETVTPPAGPERVVEGKGRQDILPIHERVGPIASNRLAVWLGRVRLIAYSLPLLAYGLCLVLVKRREKLRTDTAYRRYKFAARTAERYIKGAHVAMTHKQWDEVFTKCSRAVTDYLADKQRPGWGLSPADVKAAFVAGSIGPFAGRLSGSSGV